MRRHGYENGRGGEIRTRDPLLPKQMRYQAALRPEEVDYNRLRMPVWDSVPDLLRAKQPNQLIVHAERC